MAVSDPDGTLATPVDVVHRSGDRAREHREIASLVEEWGASAVVVGLPLSLDGSIGPAASGVLAEAAELRFRLTVTVHTHDERLTTVTAERSLREQGVRGPARRRRVDQVAAAVLLQAWLDQTGRPTQAEEPRSTT
ncbi:hypothetical protein BH20ACT2_BH20ACT2_21880 [soil metagenome]